MSTDTVENLEEEVGSGNIATSEIAAINNETPSIKKSSFLKRRNPIQNRNITIEQIRRDRKEYNSKRIEIENEKLEVQKQKIVLMKERNELLKERNELLKNRSCSVCSRDFI